MRTSVIWAAAVAAMLGVAGCNKAESPGKVDSDVAKAANTAVTCSAVSPTWMCRKALVRLWARENTYMAGPMTTTTSASAMSFSGCGMLAFRASLR